MLEAVLTGRLDARGGGQARRRADRGDHRPAGRREPAGSDRAATATVPLPRRRRRRRPRGTTTGMDAVPAAAQTIAAGDEHRGRADDHVERPDQTRAGCRAGADRSEPLPRRTGRVPSAHRVGEMGGGNRELRNTLLPSDRSNSRRGPLTSTRDSFGTHARQIGSSTPRRAVDRGRIGPARFGTARLRAPRRGCGARARRRRDPRRQLARPRDPRVVPPLPAPVELGRGVHRDRVLALRPGARRDRAALAVRGPVAQRPAAAHPLHRRRALLPRARVLADRAVAGRARRIRGRRGSSSRRSTRPRSGRSTATPPTPSGRRRSSASSCRGSPPGTTTSTASARATARGSSRSGIRGSRASTTRRSGTRRSRASRRRRRRSPSTSASTPRSSTRRSGRRTPSTTATPTSSSATASAATTRRGSAPSARSRSRTSSSTRSSSRAGEDLASIARVVGEDPEPFERAAATTRASLDSKLWSERGTACTSTTTCAPTRHVAARTWGGLAPLYCGVSPERASRLLETVREFAVTLDGGWAVPSVSADDPSFDPARYWRGPVWPMISWVIHLGLRRHGFDDEAEQLRVDPARARPRRRLLGALQRGDRRGAGHGAPVLDRRDRARPPTRPSGRHACPHAHQWRKELTMLRNRLGLVAAVGGRRSAGGSRPEPAPPPIGRADAGNVVFLSTQLNAHHRERRLPQPDRQGLLGHRSTRSTSRSGTRRSSPTGSRPSRTRARARSASSAACTATSPRSPST